MPTISQQLSQACLLGATDETRQLLGRSAPLSAMDAEPAMLLAAASGSADMLDLLIAACPAHSRFPKVLALAVGHGKANCVKILIPRSDLESPSLDELLAALADGFAGCSALFAIERPFSPGSGHEECVRMLLHARIASLGRARGQSIILDLMRGAAMFGVPECLQICLPILEDARERDSLISLAAGGGHLDCVRFLASATSPKAHHSFALRQAASTGQLKCVEFLLPLSDPADYAKCSSQATLFGFMDCADLIDQFGAALAERLALMACSASGVASPRKPTL